MNDRPLASRLGECFQAAPPPWPVLHVWRFGSAARGTRRPESDVDLAVRFADRHPLPALDVIGLLQRIGLQAASTLGLPDERIDVKELNGPGAYALYRVVSEGACVFDAAPDDRRRFVVGAYVSYFDLRLLRPAPRSRSCRSRPRHARHGLRRAGRGIGSATCGDRPTGSNPGGEFPSVGVRQV